MSARLVSMAVAYAMGSGTLRCKGAKQRPWLELKRLETERTYMLHQVRSLQRAGAGPVRAAVDMLPGRHFYDVCRARLQHDAFERAIELLAPEGEISLSKEVLEIGGGRGLASIWLDLGHWDRGTAVIPLSSEPNADALLSHLIGRGIAGISKGGNPTTLRLSKRQFAQFSGLIRHHVHRSMAHALREGSKHGTSIMRVATLV
jgi:hypothetical protein